MKLMVLAMVLVAVGMPPWISVDGPFEYIGACEFLDGTCRMESESRCALVGGNYLGDGVWCGAYVE